ncbi:type I secretion system permease/ATPase [Pseudomonas sp. CFBP 8771]|uniref:type I secretion system permease/ATPase n=1 Tax=Pseudomonas sp. CFBP 8771 TaxID=2775285 RepID=UPI00406C77FB
MHKNQPLTLEAVSGSDSLLTCIRWLCAHHGRTRSEAALIAGLSVQSPLDAEQALQVFSQAGFAAGLVERSLCSLPSVLMPLIALDRQRGAMILLGPCDHGYQVIMPALGAEPVVISAQELLELYSGFAILARPKAEALHSDAEPPQSDGHWLLSTLWRYRASYLSAAFGAVLINVLALASVFFTMNVYDRVVPNNAYVTLWSLALGVTLAIALEAVARWARGQVLDEAGKKADLVMGAVLFRQALAVRMEHKPGSSGAFAHQLREFESVRDFITSATLTVLSDLPFCLLFIGVIFAIGGALGWVPLASVLLIVAISVALQWPLSRVLRENLQETALKQGLLIESIDGLEALKALGAEGVRQRRWEHLSAQAATSALKSRQVIAASTGASAFIQQFQTVALITGGVYLIDAGDLSMGALIASVMLAGRATAPLGQVMGLAARLQQARAALASLNRLMALPTERASAQPYLSSPVLRGQVTLQGVGFAYPAPSTTPAPSILQGIDLHIDAGERVAIIGGVGSGKSTLLRVLARLYQPLHGRMSSEGVDIHQIDPADWRAAVSYVGQDARLFQGTLRDNLLIARPDASSAELLRAMTLCGVDRIAARHPLGVNLPVGERGEGLSGGQRQLVCLARSLLKRPAALLLDEPTSAMDSQTEQHFLRHLRNAHGGQTLVLVTHRPAALELVDRIIVMEHGRIVDDGPKARVLASLGRPVQS